MVAIQFVTLELAAWRRQLWWSPFSLPDIGSPLQRFLGSHGDPRGDGIGHHFHCQILAAPCSASCDHTTTHAVSIANHGVSSSALQWQPISGSENRPLSKVTGRNKNVQSVQADAHKDSVHIGPKAANTEAVSAERPAN
jgi:hypothetical protein